MLSRRLAALLIVLPCGLVDAHAEGEVETQVAAGLRTAEAFGGTSFHLTDPIAALGPSAVPALAAVLADPNASDGRRTLAACALGRMRSPEALAALRAALPGSEPAKGVRAAVEESLFLCGDREPIDARIATLATKHRDLPIAATGARLHLAETYAATGRFRIAAGLMKELVRAERDARPKFAQAYAHNWACFAALAGDKPEALEAVRIAVESDRTDLDWMAKDLDLALVHGDETFVKALTEARTRREQKSPGKRSLEREPGYAEYKALFAAYWNAMDAFWAASNRYWDDYQPWLERSGRSQGSEALDAYVKEKGPFAAPDPTDEWLPKFVAFLEKHRGTAVGREARTSILTIYGNQDNMTALVDLYLAALAEDPDLSAVARHASTALYAASHDRLGAVREALAKAVAAHPGDPHEAEVLVAVAESLGENEDKSAARTAYAEIVKRFPGTDAAEEAAGHLYELEKLGEGAAAPEFSVTDIRGRAWTLSALKGKVVLLDFWATWCGPCLGELPALKALFKEHGSGASQDFVLLGISLDQDGWALAEFLEAEGLHWPQVCDLGGFDAALAKLYHVRGIPRAVLIDREGRIAAKDLRGEKLGEGVRRLLAAPK